MFNLTYFNFNLTNTLFTSLNILELLWSFNNNNYYHYQHYLLINNNGEPYLATLLQRIISHHCWSWTAKYPGPCCQTPPNLLESLQWPSRTTHQQDRNKYNNILFRQEDLLNVPCSHGPNKARPRSHPGAQDGSRSNCSCFRTCTWSLSPSNNSRVNNKNKSDG